VRIGWGLIQGFHSGKPRGTPVAAGVFTSFRRGNFTLMTLGTVLLILLILALLGALPTWPHSRNWGYYPSGGAGFLLLVVIILLLTHVI